MDLGSLKYYHLMLSSQVPPEPTLHRENTDHGPRHSCSMGMGGEPVFAHLRSLGGVAMVRGNTQR